MNFSAPFIARPVATTLLTLGVLLVGAAAGRLLQVSPLPRVDLPTITVSAALPGASPETMAAAVTMPLERSLGRIAGVTEMTSSSTLGSSRITMQFDLGRNIDGAAREVQAALNAARSLLPAGLPAQPSYRKANPADAPVTILALTSETLTPGQMYDAASTVIAQKLSRLPGVGQVQIGGASLPAVRIELNAQALAQHGIALADVRAAVAAANSSAPRGAVEDSGRHWQVATNERGRRAADYVPVIVGYRSGAAVRLGDVAEVLDSVQDRRHAGWANDRPAVLVIVTREANANIIETVERINALLPELRASIPRAIDLSVMLERTSTVRASMRDAQHTLAIAVALVALVVLLFLRSARAALIPAVVVPTSLIGAFAVMYLLDYSLDNLSLMALTIAVGFVVDDAVVVLENVSRHIEQGMPAAQAALLGAREVGPTVLTMTLVLVAVFIPLIFSGGFVGRFVREFAVTLSATVLISLVVSLTTAPMMCARLLRPAPPAHRRGRLHAASERAFALLLGAYGRSLAWALAHSRLTLLGLALTVGLNVYLYVIIPKGFFPQQDTGQLTGRMRGDQSISFEAMRQRVDDFVRIVRADPAVANVVAFTGGAQRNAASLFVTLEPLAGGRDSAAAVAERLHQRLAHEPGATLVLTPVQDIRIGGRQSRSTYEYTIQADDLAVLRESEPAIRRALARLPELRDVDTDAQSKGLQTLVTVDRDAAARLGVSLRQVDTLLGDAFAQKPVTTLYEPLNQYRVVMGLAAEQAQSPEALDALQLTGPRGRPVPLSMVARHEQTEAALVVNHHSQFVSTTVSFNLAPGVSLSQASRAIERALRELALPSSVRGSFQGSARAFREVLASQPLLILAALLTLYILLGMLYESLVHPLTILSTLPSAGVGALLALMLFRTDFSVIALVGVFMLIGVVMKNAIMMIDVALDLQRGSGVAPSEAIRQACLLRLRPILMTSLAALLAAVPLALGRGDGAEMRQPLGIAIGGGLVMSQLLTLYTTPVVYLYLDRFGAWLRALRAPRGARRAGFAPAADATP